MEPFISSIVNFSALIVPALAFWAIAALYIQRDPEACTQTQLLYFGTLMLIAVVTLRTITTNDGCWLIHTATLGVTIVAGVMRRPTNAWQSYAADFTQ